MPQAVVEAIKLTKAYNGKTVVDKVDLSILEGQVFGFLGPNGAGKTTTILMLLGLTEPTSGTARIGGYSSTKEALTVKRIAGYVPEKVGFYDDLSAAYNLSYTAYLNRLSNKETEKRIRDSLEIVGLADNAEQRVGTFSKGMKQRLAIADVLVKDPKVAFLDEPTSGIDPEGIKKMLELISGIAKQRNMTIVLSSHQLNQVERVCQRVGIMSKGKLVVEGPLDRLTSRSKQGQYKVEVQLTEAKPEVVNAIKAIPGVVGVEVSGGRLLATCNEDLRPQIAKAVVENQGMLVQINIQIEALESIYLKYFKEA